MRISARCEYACKALLELALHWPDRDPLQIYAISEKQEIPLRYLVQILIQLKRAGFVKSARGKEGGYNLAKSPDEIKMGEVMRQTTGQLLPISELASGGDPVFDEIWREAEEAIANVLDKITFEDILNKAKGLEASLNYQI